MEFAHRNWASLIGPDKASDRAEILFGEYVSEMDAYMTELESTLQGMLDLTVVEASLRSDTYWSIFKDLVEEFGAEQPCRIGTRVQNIRGSLNCQWYRNRFIQQQGSSKSSPLSTYIRKTQKTRYAKQAFKNEPEWAQELIGLTEDEYELLRKRAAVFTKMRRLLSECKKLTNQSYRISRE